MMWLMLSLVAGAHGADTSICAECPNGKSAGYPEGCTNECKEDPSDDGRVWFDGAQVVAWATLEGEITVPQLEGRIELDLHEVAWVVFADGTLSTRTEIEAWLTGEPVACPQ